MTHADLADPEAQARLFAHLGELWDVDLRDLAPVRFSTRMTHGLGSSRPAAGAITVADRLRAGPAWLLREVVVHEAAHVAALRLHGPAARPHGPEWRALMAAAGLAPRATVPAEQAPPPARQRRRWRHACPRCGAARIAGRPVRRWRCSRCRRRGRSGRLEISPVEPQERRAAR